MKKESVFETLSLEQYEIAKPFFKGFKIYSSFLNSILERRNQGTIFTDNKNNPSFLLVCSPSAASNLNAPVYLAGELDLITLKKIRAFLQTFPKLSLVVPLEWKYRFFFEEAGFLPIERIQLRRPVQFFDSDIWKQSLPSQYSISKIDENQFSQCNWRLYILSCYGNEEQFFTHGKGFCLLDEGKIAAESYELFIANGQTEVGVITDTRYRGQNLGTIICATLLDDCYKNNIEPYWNCDIHNGASAAVAKKLGFQEDCHYLFLRWMSS